MNITLVIATFNGEETLKESLNTINLIEAGDNYFNIIYINNNSADSSFSILEEFSSKHDFLLLQQEKRGKNSALNTIFNYIDKLGDLIIFSDDDVLFTADFVLNYAKFAKAYQDAYIFGGRVDAYWSEQPKAELLDGIDSVVAFAITPEERGYKTGYVKPEQLHGPNMAIRKEVFLSGVRFNESIGPNGSNYVMGSESELLLRLKNMGFSAVYDHDNPVKHIIMPYQLTEKWLSGRAFKAGRSMLMHQKKSNCFKPVSQILGYPRWALIQAIKFYIIMLVRPKSRVSYYQALWKFNHLRGYCFEYELNKKK